jgi:hypothetical protein
MQSIYLYKPPKSKKLINTWIYYRVASISAEEPAGTLYAPMEICRVSWPTFKDIPPATETPGITGLRSAHEHLCHLLREQLNVEHEQSVLIGFLP